MLMFMRSPRIRLGRRRPRKIASAKLFHRWGGEDMDRFDGDSNQMLMFMRSPRIRLGRRRPRKIASAKLFHRWGGEDMDRFVFIYFLYTSYCLVFKLIFFMRLNEHFDNVLISCNIQC
uniref:Uncharacterized protein n=1 Tax=Ascaris lumbricoides TaxID=6252 RepID=A0A0M3IVD4_ASCLU